MGVCECVCESMSVHVQSMIVVFVSESHSDNHTLNKAVACFHIRSSSIVSKQCRLSHILKKSIMHSIVT